MNLGLKKTQLAQLALTKYPRINCQTHSLLILILASIFSNHLLSPFLLDRFNLPWESNVRQPRIQLVQQEQRAGPVYVWRKRGVYGNTGQQDAIRSFFRSYVCSKQHFVNNVENHICCLWECVLIGAHTGCVVMHVAPALCASGN